MRPSIPLALYADELKEIAKTLGVENLRVFGSVARGSDGPDSDVDILAELRPGANSMRAMAFAEYAREILGFHVDLLLSLPDKQETEFEKTISDELVSL